MNKTERERKYFREYARRWRAKHPDKVKENSKKRDKRYWDAILMAYGARCNCCGEENIIFLTLDHVNNDGASHRKMVQWKSRGTRGTWLWVINNNFPPNFQILCYNCNMGKYRNGGICPHKEIIDGDSKEEN